MADEDKREATMTVVDGREALAYVIILPNEDGNGVLIDAAASGISKQQAAYVLRHLAKQWDPEGETDG